MFRPNTLLRIRCTQSLLRSQLAQRHLYGICDSYYHRRRSIHVCVMPALKINLVQLVRSHRPQIWLVILENYYLLNILWQRSILIYRD